MLKSFYDFIQKAHMNESMRTVHYLNGIKAKCDFTTL